MKGGSTPPATPNPGAKKTAPAAAAAASTSTTSTTANGWIGNSKVVLGAVGLCVLAAVVSKATNVSKGQLEDMCLAVRGPNGQEGCKLFADNLAALHWAAVDVVGAPVGKALGHGVQAGAKLVGYGAGAAGNAAGRVAGLFENIEEVIAIPVNAVPQRVEELGQVPVIDKQSVIEDLPLIVDVAAAASEVVNESPAAVDLANKMGQPMCKVAEAAGSKAPLCWKGAAAFLARGALKVAPVAIGATAAYGAVQGIRNGTLKTRAAAAAAAVSARFAKKKGGSKEGEMVPANFFGLKMLLTPVQAQVLLALSEKVTTGGRRQRKTIRKRRAF